MVNRQRHGRATARLLHAMLAVLLGVAGLVAPAPSALTQDAPLQPAAAHANSNEQIVYVDKNGYVRVYDPNGSPAVQFVSPDGGYTQAALGDFNHDGDEEIVAISNQENNRRLVVFDPVVASGPVNQNQQYNGIPWRLLYTLPLVNEPEVVGTGDFDPDTSGSEIVFTEAVASTESPGAKATHVVILTQAGGPGDGTAWRELSSVVTPERWTSLAAGQLVAPGPDDLALVDNDRGALALYHVIGGVLTRYLDDETSSRPWNDVAIGQVDATDTTSLPELVLVRRADTPLPSLVVWRWDADRGRFSDATLRAFAPSPRVVWLANVNGTANQVIFMLRNVSRTSTCTAPYTSAPAQLLMRRVHATAEQPALLDLCLDIANDFRYGAAGDLNGDGVDEVAVISGSQIRIFSNLTASAVTATNVAVSSNALTIAIGNLSANGFVTLDTLAVSPARLDFTIAAGGQSASAQSVAIGNSASSNPIPLVIHTSTSAPYLRWTLSDNSTPATLSVSIDGRDLLPGLTYAAEILVDSGAGNVLNAPLKLPVVVKVTDGLVLRPSGANLVRQDCATPGATGDAAATVDLRVLGTPGIAFSAKVGPAGVSGAAPVQATDAVTWPVAGELPWITAATSPSTTTPSLISLALDTTKANSGAPSPFNQAVVQVTGSLSGASFERSAVITLVCANNVVYFPYVRK